MLLKDREYFSMFAQQILKPGQPVIVKSDNRKPVS